ncbi:TolC family protein [Roseateles sp. LKC17W]|uniref:TolC family protein n=1 Tax=Pelomonas margarita TaxID=3299031 RepID=A0ABW7FPE4_9BURK
MNRPTPTLPRRRLLVASGSAALVGLAGCSTTPAPLNHDRRAVDNLKNLRAEIALEEPVKGPISLYEAMARAIKYNLDGRIEAMSESLKLKQAELRRVDMLPALVAQSGFVGRSNDAGSRSRSLLSGNQSLEPSTSSERRSTSADIRASWDVLDFGLAYVRSLQQAHESSISAERRRKVLTRIIEDVRTAYWRAVSADRTFRHLSEVEGMALKALAQAEALESRRVASPLTVLAFQRDLLGVQSEAQKLQRELTLAKTQLAALMNLTPATPYQLVLPDRTDLVPELPGSANEMVLTGLRFRPELREAGYQRKITELEDRASLLRSLPSLKAMLGLNYDSNQFLYNNDWLDFSARVSWSLMSVFRRPLEKAALLAELDVQDQRDLALTMAVMTQVHVARVRFIRLSQELSVVRQANGVQTRLTEASRGAYKARAISQQSLVREEMNSVLAEVRYDTAYADLQNAYANLYASMGLDNFDIKLDGSEPLAQIVDKLEIHWSDRALSLPPLPKDS